MLDIRFIRENPEAVKENIQKKFQDSKLPLVDEVIELDRENRAAHRSKAKSRFFTTRTSRIVTLHLFATAPRFYSAVPP